MAAGIGLLAGFRFSFDSGFNPVLASASFPGPPALTFAALRRPVHRKRQDAAGEELGTVVVLPGVALVGLACRCRPTADLAGMDR